MMFRNTTTLDGGRILDTFLEAAHPFPTDALDIRIRYSRGADFSGTCFYEHDRLTVNVGRHLKYPYCMDTYIARSVTTRLSWHKPIYSIELADAYQLALFVLLHEYYHWLVKRAGRNTRQKESMCDRYATRFLIDRFNLTVRDADHQPVSRNEWDFQDVYAFVAAAQTRTPAHKPARAARTTMPIAPASRANEQLLLFDIEKAQSAKSRP